MFPESQALYFIIAFYAALTEFYAALTPFYSIMENKWVQETGKMRNKLQNFFLLIPVLYTDNITNKTTMAFQISSNSTSF